MSSAIGAGVSGAWVAGAATAVGSATGAGQAVAVVRDFTPLEIIKSTFRCRKIL